MTRLTTGVLQPLLAPVSTGSVPPFVKLIQAAAILFATSGAGMSAALSWAVVPRIVEAQSGVHVTRQWLRMHAATQKYLRFAMIWAPSILHAILGFKIPSRARLYYYTAFATLSIVPWSYTREDPIQWKMERRLKMTTTDGDQSPLIEYTPWGPEDAYSLVKLWGSQNLFPSAVSFLAGCAGLYVALS